METPADPENQLCELLARFDEALAAGSDAGPFISDPELGNAEPRVVGLQHCIRLLEMDRRFCLLGAGESDTKPLSNLDPSDVASADTCFRRTAVSSPDDSNDREFSVVPFAETAFAGSTIGRFQILRRLGTGGFGVVFLARDPVLHRFVAVKVPKPEALTVPGFRQRFLRESQVIARLSHPHIVPIHEAGEDGVVTYQVTGFCGGGSLADRLRAARQAAKTHPGSSGSNGWSMPPATAVELLTGLAEAVQYAHDHGILHRDLKPANILLHPFEDVDPEENGPIIAPGPLDELCRTYRPMVADFGLARMFHPDDEASARSPEAAIARSECAAISETGKTPVRGENLAGEAVTEFAGTLQYMAPEQIKRQRSLIGPATDVWGLGAILYEVLTGRPPFTLVEADRRNPTGRTALVVQPRILNVRIPPDLEAICLKCLDADVFRRYGNVHGLISDLRSFSRGEPVFARPWPWHERLMNWTRRKPAVAALMVLSGCLLFGLGLLAVRHYQRLSELNSRLILTARELEKEVKASDIQRQRAEQQSRQATEQAWLAEHREYAAGMVQANEMFQEKDMRRAAEELRRWKDYEGVDDVRGFEWYYLAHLTARYKVHRGHSATVESVAFTSDGRFCYSIGRDGEIQYWNTETGEVLNVWTTGGRSDRCRAKINRLATHAVMCRQSSFNDLTEFIYWDLKEGHELIRIPSLSEFTECVAVSADGRMVAWESNPSDAQAGPFVHLWRSRTEEQQVLRLPETETGRILTEITDIEFTPDGSQLIVAAATGSGEGRQSMVFSCSLFRSDFERASPEATQSVSQLQTDAEGTSKSEGVYEMTSLYSELSPGIVNRLGISLDGRRICLVAHSPASLKILNLGTRHEVAAFAFGTDAVDTYDAFAFDMAGQMLAIGLTGAGATDSPANFGNLRTAASVSSRQHLVLWNVESGEQTIVPFFTNRGIRSLEFRDQDRMLVVGEFEGRVSLQPLDAVDDYIDLPGHSGSEVWGVAFATDGDTLYSTGDDHCLRSWDLKTHSEGAVGKAHSALVSCLAVSGDGRWVATGGYDNAVTLWDARSLKPQVVLGGHSHNVRCVAFSKDSLVLASAGRDRVIRLWSIPDGEPLGLCEGHVDTIRSMSFLPDGHLVSVDGSGLGIIWNQDGTMQKSMQASSGLHCVSPLPTELKLPMRINSDARAGDTPLLSVAPGDVLALGQRFGIVQLRHRLSEKSFIETQLEREDTTSVVFSPDGKTVAVASRGSAVHLLNVFTGQRVLTIKDLPAIVNQLAFSPDGQLLAAAFADGRIRLWAAPKNVLPLLR